MNERGEGRMLVVCVPGVGAGGVGPDGGEEEQVRKGEVEGAAGLKQLSALTILRLHLLMLQPVLHHKLGCVHELCHI